MKRHASTAFRYPGVRPFRVLRNVLGSFGSAFDCWCWYWEEMEGLMTLKGVELAGGDVVGEGTKRGMEDADSGGEVTSKPD